MPTHADPIQSEDLEPPLTALTRPMAQLERYAGWLAKDHVSNAVRADVRALGVAVGAGGETSLLMLTLDKDLGRLPSGDVRKMLRKASQEIRAVLGPDMSPRGGEAL